MKYSKILELATTGYLIIFVVDAIFELFKINSSGTVTTFLGLQITTLMTAKKLDTTFSLTWSVLLWYIVFMVIINLVYIGYMKIWRQRKYL